jgi:hypothetical protein
VLTDFLLLQRGGFDIITVKNSSESPFLLMI